VDRIDQREIERPRPSAPEIVKQRQHREGPGRVDLLEGQVTQSEFLMRDVDLGGTYIAAQSISTDLEFQFYFSYCHPPFVGGDAR
jgi:hypothetical protein